MEKILLLMITLFFGACVHSNKTSWQGIYYPKGCLACSSEYVYGPIFKNYSECKNWAETKMTNGEDKAGCGRNCVYEGKMDMSKCELVVRSWFIPELPDSLTFDTYKE